MCGNAPSEIKSVIKVIIYERVNKQQKPSLYHFELNGPYRGINLKVGICRMYGEGRSAGFESADSESGEVLFTMDVDVNRPVPPTKNNDAAAYGG